MSSMINYLMQLFMWCIIGGILVSILALIIKSRLNFFQILFFAYLTGVLSQTIFPTLFYDRVNNSLRMIFGNSGSHLNLIPFHTISQQLLGNIDVNKSDVVSTVVVNILGNIMLFLPLGILVQLTIPRLNNLKKVSLFGLLCSGLIEVIQFVEGRSCDVDDVILNVLGFVVGFLFFKVFSKFIK